MDLEMEPRAYWLYVRNKLAVKKDEASGFADMMLQLWFLGPDVQ